MDKVNLLRQFYSELSGITAQEDHWPQFEKWKAGIIPYFRQYFSGHIEDLERLSSKPEWVKPRIVIGPVSDRLESNKREAKTEAFRKNNQLVLEKKQSLSAFIDSLIRMHEPTNISAVSDSVNRMPFRPYQRFEAEVIGIADVHTRACQAAFDGAADEEELQAYGGRTAVFASIRRHVPEFDADRAQAPNAPSWLTLKPVLVRCGLAVTNETTLTEIKAFLDVVTPGSNLLPRGKDIVAVPDPSRVFVIHGRNLPARDAMFTFLRSLGLKPIEWEQAVSMTGKGAPFVGDILDSAFGQAQAVVVVLTGDDLAMLRQTFCAEHEPMYETELTPQARPNVLFEAGLAFGRHPERTILIQIGQLRPFSDVAGRHAIMFSGSAENRATLRDRLETAGCSVSGSGTDWLRAGNFDEAILAATAEPASTNVKQKKK
jgi:predicted nucleotide-binding protein